MVSLVAVIPADQCKPTEGQGMQQVSMNIVNRQLALTLFTMQNFLWLTQPLVVMS